MLSGAGPRLEILGWTRTGRSLVGPAILATPGTPPAPLGSSEPCLPSTARLSSAFGPRCPCTPQLCIYQQFIYHFFGARPKDRRNLITALVPDMAGRFGNNYGTAREAPRTVLTAPMTREAGVRLAGVTPRTAKRPLCPAPGGKDLKRVPSFSEHLAQR